MPGPIRCVTVATHNLANAATAYGQHLGYRTVSESTVPNALANLWGAPSMGGRRQTLLAPEKVPDKYIRLVDIDPVEGYAPLKTYGWNAIEIIVRDTDQLAGHLDGSPFNIVGPPEDLSFSDAIRAMQVAGPAGEMLYLTMSKRPIEEFDLPAVRGEVDHAFIVILGGEMEAMRKFYTEKMGLPEAPVFDAKVTVLSRTYGQPLDQPHALCAMATGGQCYIELDQYPDEAVDRPFTAGQLPPGQCMVSFGVDSLDAYDVPWRASPATVNGSMYDGARVAVTVGPSGEYIELIESVGTS